MNFKLEISRDNTNYYKLDLFPDPELEYNLDFYDNLEIDKVRLPFSSSLKIPLTTANQDATRFNYNPLTSDKDDFPKTDFFFEITVLGSSNTIIQGMLNVKSIEYNSNEPYIEVDLIDFISKYINDLKDTELYTLYDATNPAYRNYYRTDQSFLNFSDTVAAGGEGGVIGVNPTERPIIFPYIDFCNDVQGKFGYAARQFTEYGVGLNKVGIVPAFNVKQFLQYIGRYLSDTGFNTRVDSKLFALNYAEQIPEFEAEKLHMLIPSKLEANLDTNTRTFDLHQAGAWTGTNEDMFSDFKRDDPTAAKDFVTDWYYGAETFGNYGPNPEGGPNSFVSLYGADIRKNGYPENVLFGNERGYFAPHMSFNGGIKFANGTLSAQISQVKYEIPLVNDDQMVSSVFPGASTMKFAFFIGVYENGEMVKKIRMENSNGQPIELLSQAAAAVQGTTEKVNHSSSSTHNFYEDTSNNSRFAILEPALQSGYTDTLQWDEVPELYMPANEEIEINGESRYGVNYFLEPIEGTLSVRHTTSKRVHDSNTLYLDTPQTSDVEDVALRKVVTRISDYTNIDLDVTANKAFNPYRITDEYNIKNSLKNTATMKTYEVLLALCKRFNCGIFYEYDSDNNINVLRIDPLHLVRAGNQDINQYVDDLKSAKVFIGGDKVKNLTIANQSYGLYYDDENGDGITIGSTTQEINPTGISDLEIKLKSSIYYKSVAGDVTDYQINQNYINGAVSEREIGFTKNLFTEHQKIGLRFAYVDKPEYRTKIKRPLTVTKFQRPAMYTETQRTYIDWITHVFNGRLFPYNNQGWNLMAEDENGDTTDYYDLYTQDEKIKFSDSPSIEFDMVIPTSELADLDFLLKDFSASRLTQDTIAVKSAEGDVYEDFAYITIKGILK